MLPEHAALLIVDVQNDFCPGGSLAVGDGDEVIAPLNAMAAAMATAGRPVYASRDWHPRDTTHFKDRGGVWPVHCVAESRGAAFHPDLTLPVGTIVVSKGLTSGEDGYSAFDGRTQHGRRLAAELAAQGISHVIVGGLATDYCVKASVLDARRAGLEVTVLQDAVRAVNLHPTDGVRALDEMVAAGARVESSTALLGSPTRP